MREPIILILMIPFIIKMAFLTVFITTILVTLLIHLVPGDPVQIMFAQSQGSTPEQIEEVRRNLGLDKPIYVQYFTYLKSVITFDWGYSEVLNEDVSDHSDISPCGNKRVGRPSPSSNSFHISAINKLGASLYSTHISHFTVTSFKPVSFFLLHSRLLINVSKKLNLLHLQTDFFYRSS